MADEGDLENEREQSQFKEFFLNKLKKVDLDQEQQSGLNKVLSESDGQRINLIVNDIMVRKKNGTEIKE